VSSPATGSASSPSASGTSASGSISSGSTASGSGSVSGSGDQQVERAVQAYRDCLKK
jgi:hypothetical protein